MVGCEMPEWDWHARRQELMDVLGVRELRSISPNNKPLFYGYIRTKKNSPGKIRYLHKCLHWFAEEHHIEIANIFTDRSTRHDSLTRPGFAGLLDVCSLPRPTFALLLTPSHLSWDEELFGKLKRQILRTGARLVFVHGEGHEGPPLITTRQGDLVPLSSDEAELAGSNGHSDTKILL